MKLIVGLGNPGNIYEYTRHNVGFMAVDRFATETTDAAPFKHHAKTHTQIIKLPGADGVILAKPQTYMNHSGRAIRALKDYFQITNSRILIIHDEYALPFGTVRTRTNGSHAGHKGMASVIKYIGPGFARIRIGIRNDDTEPMEKFVLGQFNRAEQTKLSEILNIVSRRVGDFVNGEFTVDTFQIDL